MVASRYRANSNIAPRWSAVNAAELEKLLRFHLDVGFGGDQGQRLLLGVFGVDLDDGKAGRSGCHGSDYDPEQSAAAADAGGIGLASCGDHDLSLRFVTALHNRNLLVARGEKSSVLDVFDADDGRIILQHHRDGIEIIDVVDRYTEGSGLPGRQRKGLRVEVQAGVLIWRSGLRGCRLGLSSARLRNRHVRRLRSLLRRRLRPRRAEVTLSADGDILLDTRGDRPQVAARPVRHAHDTRNEHDQDVVFGAVRFVFGKQILHQGNLGKTWPSVYGFAVGLAKQAAQNAGLAFPQANVVLDLVLTDDRLLDAADGLEAGDLRDFQRDLEADFVVGVDARRDVDVHADVDVGELCVHERIDRRGPHADASLEAAGSDGHAAADIEFGWLAVDGANFGVLDDLAGRVGKHEVGGGAGKRNGVVARAEGEALERRAVIGGRGAASGAALRRGRGSRGRESDRSGLARENAQVTQPVGAGRENFHLNDHFRLGLVDVLQQAA